LSGIEFLFLRFKIEEFNEGRNTICHASIQAKRISHEIAEFLLKWLVLSHLLEVEK